MKFKPMLPTLSPVDHRLIIILSGLHLLEVTTQPRLTLNLLAAILLLQPHAFHKFNNNVQDSGCILMYSPG